MILRTVTSVALCALGISKLIFEYDATFQLPPAAYVAEGLLLLLLSGTWLSRWWRAAALVTILLAVAWLAYGTTFASCGKCGCLGAKISISPRTRILLAASIGFLAATALSLANRSQSQPPH